MFLRLFLVLMGICGAVRQAWTTKKNRTKVYVGQVISNDVGTMQTGGAGGGYVCECWAFC
eukprot:s121_g1.t1